MGNIVHTRTSLTKRFCAICGQTSCVTDNRSFLSLTWAVTFHHPLPFGRVGLGTSLHRVRLGYTEYSIKFAPNQQERSWHHHYLSLCNGHHKLIRWWIVTLRGVDGYGRMIVYLECSTNNRATTVYKLFMAAVERFGLPSRVRSDLGGENYMVARHMLRHRGSDRSSMITGNSTHNQRIERLWVEMHGSVILLYYRLFYFLSSIPCLMHWTKCICLLSTMCIYQE